MITQVSQANEIIARGESDLAVMGREYLRNPYFAFQAAQELDVEPEVPWQYARGFM